MRQNEGVKWWIFISAALTAIGGFGPWATGPFGISADGTNGDGWFLIVGAALGAGLFYARRVHKRAGGWATAAGVLGFAVTLYDRSHLENTINRGGAFARALLHVGWGLDLGLIASLSLAIAGVVAILKAEREAEAPAEAPAGSAEG